MTNEEYERIVNDIVGSPDSSTTPRRDPVAEHHAAVIAAQTGQIEALEKIVATQQATIATQNDTLASRERTIELLIAIGESRARAGGMREVLDQLRVSK